MMTTWSFCCPQMETTLSRMEETAHVRPTFAKLPSDKKERILDVAIDEFSRCGYEQASINRMVGRLGIAKGSIFQYFGSKKNLYFHIFEHAVALVKKSLKRVKAGTDGGGLLHSSCQVIAGRNLLYPAVPEDLSDLP